MELEDKNQLMLKPIGSNSSPEGYTRLRFSFEDLRDLPDNLSAKKVRAVMEEEIGEGSVKHSLTNTTFYWIDIPIGTSHLQVFNCLQNIRKLL